MVGGKELEDTGRTEGGKGAVEWGKRPGGNEFWANSKCCPDGGAVGGTVSGPDIFTSEIFFFKLRILFSVLSALDHDID